VYEVPRHDISATIPSVSWCSDLMTRPDAASAPTVTTISGWRSTNCRGQANCMTSAATITVAAIVAHTFGELELGLRHRVQ